MARREDGGSAFPKAVEYADSPPEDGMTLRDYFAAQVVQGVLANQKTMVTFDRAELAEDCYAMADAMLKERDKSPHL